MIEKMGIEHLEEVAKIHVTSWSSYEISVKLGEECLKKCFYGSIVTSPVAFGYVYIDEGKIAGYATGFYKYQEFNCSALKKNLFYLSALILRKLFTRRVKISDVIDILQDNKKLRKLQFPEHHLGALALSNEYKKTSRSQEIIISTMEKVLDELESRGCKGYWGASDKRNKPMQMIFLSLGFKRVDTVPYISKVITVFEKTLAVKDTGE